MKIQELIFEAGEYQKAKQAANRLTSPSQWVKPTAGSSYQKSKDSMTKLFSPSQWFKGSGSKNDDELDEPEKISRSATKTSVQSSTVDIDKIKQITKNVLRGEPNYKEDLAALASFQTGLENGSIQVSVDSTELSKTIKSIRNNTALNAAQIKLLQNFSS